MLNKKNSLMRKLLLSIFALASVAATTAQTVAQLPLVTVKSVAAKDIAVNQKYVFVPGADDPVSGWGMPDRAGNMFKMAQVIPSTYLEAYAGAKIVGIRFLTQAEMTVKPNLMELGSKMTVVAKAGNMQTEASPLNDDHTAFDENWNEVTFDTPYTIPSSPSNLMVSFDYSQASTQDADGYPFLMGQTSDANAVIKAYGNFGMGPQWKDVRTGNTMCVQLLVEKEGGNYTDDLSVVSIIADPMVKVEDWQLFPFQFIIRNSSDGECDDCLFAIMFDGEEVGYCETVPGYGVGKQGAIYSTGFYPSRHKHADGVHTIGIKIKEVNGKAPEGNTDDDMCLTQLRIYTETTDRQYNLVEHHTSWSEPSCTVGYDAMKNLMKERDDVAWVSIHGNADEKHPDPMTVDGATTIYRYSDVYPLFNINRSKTDYGTTDMTLVDGNAQLTADSISSAMNTLEEKVPALVDLSVKSSFMIADGSAQPQARLILTVKGEGVANASKILDNAVLGVYITQNEVSERQKTSKSWTDDYKHTNVMRAIATENPLGDDIVWNGDNFEKTYEVEFPAGKHSIADYKDFNAVAYVSLPYMLEKDNAEQWAMSADNVWVNQCYLYEIKEGDITGIESIGTSSNAKVVARYSVDGTKIMAPQKGINILKMSDGTTRKVVVGK